MVKKENKERSFIGVTSTKDREKEIRLVKDFNLARLSNDP